MFLSPIILLGVQFFGMATANCVCDTLESACVDQDMVCQNGGLIDTSAVGCDINPNRKCVQTSFDQSDFQHEAKAACQCINGWSGFQCGIPSPQKCTDADQIFDPTFIFDPTVSKTAECLPLWETGPIQLLNTADAMGTILINAYNVNTSSGKIQVKANMSFQLHTRVFSTDPFDANHMTGCSEVLPSISCTATGCTATKDAKDPTVLHISCPTKVCTACTVPDTGCTYVSQMASVVSASAAPVTFKVSQTNSTTGVSRVDLNAGGIPLAFSCHTGACVNQLSSANTAAAITAAAPASAALIPLAIFFVVAMVVGTFVVSYFRTGSFKIWGLVNVRPAKIIAAIGGEKEAALLADENLSSNGEAGKSTIMDKDRDKDFTPATGGIGMMWEDVSVSLSTASRQILCGVNGALRPGEVVAILGPSGAGKSTLLDVLAGRRKGGGVTGGIELGGSVGSGGTGEEAQTHNQAALAKLHRKRVISYVTQDDELLESQTVRETLVFSAVLRCTKPLKGAELDEVVNQALNDLAISHIAESRVGSPGTGGISGGERKRVSVGVELVTRPGILVLDEPTSGLDSHAAEMLLNLLHRLAKKKACPCLFTIHQVTKRFFQSFDSILLLARNGRLAYFGPPWLVEHYLATYANRPLPPKASPAEFLLEITATRNLASVNKLTDAFEVSPFTAALKARVRAMRDQRHEATIGAIVSIKHPNGTGKGKLVWAGETDQKNGEWCGVELEEAEGQHDGSVDGKRYFQCKSMHGMLVRRDGLFVWPTTTTAAASSSSSSSSSTSAVVAKPKDTSSASFEGEKIETVDTVVAEDEKEDKEEKEAEKEREEEMDVESFDRPRRNLLQQIYYVSLRQVRHTARDMSLVLTHLIVSLFMAIFLGILFWKVDPYIPGIVNRLGLLFFLLLYLSLTAMSAVGAFITQRKLFWRERAAGFYGSAVYFLSQYLNDLIFLRILPPALIALIIYPMAGLQDTAEAFSAFVFLTMMTNLVAASLCMTCSAASASPGQANFVAVLAIMFCMTFGGLFLSNGSSGPITKIRLVSYFNYGYEALTVNEFSGLQLFFNPKLSGATVNITISGEQVLENYAMDPSNYSRDNLALILIFVILTVITFLCVKFLHRSPKTRS